MSDLWTIEQFREYQRTGREPGETPAADAAAGKPRPPRDPLEPTESEFQRALVEWFGWAVDSRDAKLIHVPNQRPDRVERMFLAAMGVEPGAADLLVMLAGGRGAWLELKTASGRQSAAQRDFAALCARLDWPYAVARTIAEAATVLRSWGVRVREAPPVPVTRSR